MSDPVHLPNALIEADEICEMLLRNLEIEFKLSGDAMPREEAVKHFEKRKALILVRQMILDEGIRISTP